MYGACVQYSTLQCSAVQCSNMWVWVCAWVACRRRACVVAACGKSKVQYVLSMLRCTGTGRTHGRGDEYRRAGGQDLILLVAFHSVAAG